MKNPKIVILLAALASIATGLWWWWQHEKVYPSTDDAYLQANILTIAPQVGGRVDRVAVSENDFVKAGDLLVQLDTSALDAAVAAAQAQYEIARQSAGASASNVAAATADLASAKAALTDAEVSFDRTLALFRLGDVAQSVLDQATANRDQAQAAAKAAEAALAAAQDQAGAAGDDNAAVRAALANLATAQIELGYSRITAPAAGWVSNIELREGSVVAEGAPLFALVEAAEWWVDANFKETDLARIRPGQPVALSLDMYPGLSLTGTVESIGAGSGAVFSILPPQNATGNWVKVTQRFPVRIRLDGRPQDAALKLRVGASVTATVDTSSMDAPQ